jgi:hypothetical protein
VVAEDDRLLNARAARDLLEVAVLLDGPDQRVGLTKLLSISLSRSSWSVVLRIELVGAMRAS